MRRTVTALRSMVAGAFGASVEWGATTATTFLGFYWFYVMYIVRNEYHLYKCMYTCVYTSQILNIYRYHGEILTLLPKGLILCILAIPSMCYFSFVWLLFCYQNCDCMFYHMLYFIMLIQKWLDKYDQSTKLRTYISKPATVANLAQ